MLTSIDSRQKIKNIIKDMCILLALVEKKTAKTKIWLDILLPNTQATKVCTLKLKHSFTISF